MVSQPVHDVTKRNALDLRMHTNIRARLPAALKRVRIRIRHKHNALTRSMLITHGTRHLKGVEILAVLAAVDDHDALGLSSSDGCVAIAV